MPRAKAFNQKNKKKNCKNLEKAWETRDLNNQTRNLARGVIVARPNMDLALAYLQRLILELTTRAGLLRQNKAPESPKDDICLHPTSIGSSQIQKILQPASLTLYKFHTRLYSKGARIAGRVWEDYFKDLPYDMYAHEGLIVHELIEQKTRYSLKYPWVCATPDFIGVVSKTYNSPKHLAVIEIKHTKNRHTFNSTLNYHETQVQVSLDCYNINKGYLVTYWDQGKNLEDAPCRVDMIDRNYYLDTNKDAILKNYARFLSNCIKEVTAVSLDQDMIIEQVVPLISTQELPFINNLEELKALPVTPERPKCCMSKAHKAKKTKKYDDDKQAVGEVAGPVRLLVDK